MRGAMVGLALALAPAAALAQATEQFDLACRGTLITGYGAAGILTERRYHLDLKAGRWCFDGCVTPKVFTSISPDTITLEKIAGRDNPPRHTDINRFVNRQSGGVFDSDGDGYYYTGACEKADFTPLPQPKF